MSSLMKVKLRSTQDIPVPYNERQRTDLFCTIINTVFVVLLFIVCCAVLSVDNLRRMSYPNDADGRACGYDIAVTGYPYLYFTSGSDPTKRLCVSACPVAGDTRLNCLPTGNLSCSANSNPKHQVVVYDSYLDNTRIGLFCFPTDEALKKKIMEQSGIQFKYDFLGFYDAIWQSIWVSILFALVSYFLVRFFPHRAVPWTICIGGVVFFIFGLLVPILATGYLVVRLLVCLSLFALGAACCYTLINQKRRQSVFICTRLMETAALIHKKEWKGILQPFAVILSFMAFFGVLLVLIGFQVLSAWSCGSLVFVADYPFFSVVGVGSWLLCFFVFLQFLWAMSFLKEAFNFVVSGYATQWYYLHGKESYLVSARLLLEYHWGSVLGGSIMLSLFYFTDFFLAFFNDDEAEKSRQQGKSEIYEDRIEDNNDGCLSFFDLVRSESMGYINLVNYPYCNASRYCDFLALQSSFYDYGQTTNRVFRLAQHIIPIFLTLLIAMITMKSTTGSSGTYGVLFITGVSIFTITYILAFQSDQAEGLVISTYVEEVLNRFNLVRAPNAIKKVYQEDMDKTYANTTLSDLLLHDKMAPLEESK